MASTTHRIGSIVWHDLTVRNAEDVRTFYSEVVGWSSSGVRMGDYEDYCMTPPGQSEPAAGVCHAQGVNASLPPQWLMYIQVDSVAAAVERAAALGGKILDGPRIMGGHNFCVIQDPAGAVAALIEG